MFPFEHGFPIMFKKVNTFRSHTLEAAAAAAKERAKRAHSVRILSRDDAIKDMLLEARRTATADQWQRRQDVFRSPTAPSDLETLSHDDAAVAAALDGEAVHSPRKGTRTSRVQFGSPLRSVTRNGSPAATTTTTPGPRSPPVGAGTGALTPVPPSTPPPALAGRPMSLDPLAEFANDSGLTPRQRDLQARLNAKAAELMRRWGARAGVTLVPSKDPKYFRNSNNSHILRTTIEEEHEVFGDDGGRGVTAAASSSSAAASGAASGAAEGSTAVVQAAGNAAPPEKLRFWKRFLFIMNSLAFVQIVRDGGCCGLYLLWLCSCWRCECLRRVWSCRC